MPKANKLERQYDAYELSLALQVSGREESRHSTIVYIIGENIVS